MRQEILDSRSRVTGGAGHGGKVGHVGIVGIRQPEFGRRLRRLRQDRRLSQRDVAGTVVNPSYISLLESGARVPTLEVVLQIARALAVAPEELVGEEVLPGRTEQAEMATPAREDVDRRLVHDILVRSAMDFGALDEAQVRHERAYTAAMRGGSPIAVLEHGMALQDVLNQRGDHATRYRLLADLLPAAEKFGVPELVVKLRLDKAAAARDCGHLPEALELAESAMATLPGTELTGTSEHVRAFGVLISIKVDSGEAGDIPGLVDRMLAAAEDVGSPIVLGRSHWAASVAFARTGDGERAERHVRQAKDMLAHPGTSIREWGRFASAAASALLDTDAELPEIEKYVGWMRAAQELLDTTDPGRTVSIEARYALRTGDARKALDLASQEIEGLPSADRIRLLRTKGRALHQLNRTDEAIGALRAAAQLCEHVSAFRLAAQLWREIDQIRSS